MAKEIIWTKRARAKFNNIISFLDKEWGENVTTTFVQKAYSIIELLAEQPLLVHWRMPKKELEDS